MKKTQDFYLTIQQSMTRVFDPPSPMCQRFPFILDIELWMQSLKGVNISMYFVISTRKILCDQNLLALNNDFLVQPLEHGILVDEAFFYLTILLETILRI